MQNKGTYSVDIITCLDRLSDKLYDILDLVKNAI